MMNSIATVNEPAQDFKCYEFRIDIDSRGFDGGGLMRLIASLSAIPRPRLRPSSGRHLESGHLVISLSEKQIPLIDLIYLLLLRI